MSAINLGYRTVDGVRQPTVLPATGVPVFLWFGDSIGVGSASTVASATTHPYFQDPTLGTTGPLIAYYWTKWLEETSANVWNKSTRLTKAVAGTETWKKIHPRLGHNAATGAYSGLADTSPVWGLAQRLFGQFVDPNGVALPIRILKCAVSSTALGPVAASHNASWSPTHNDGTFQLATQYYVKPAINALLTASLRPFIVGMAHTAGGSDGVGDTAFGGILAGLAEQWTTSCVAFRKAMSEYIGIGGTIPTVWTETYKPDPSAAGVDYLDILEVRRLQREFKGPAFKLCPISGLDRQADDTHQTGLGSWKMGREVANTYRSWLASSPTDLFAYEVLSAIP